MAQDTGTTFEKGKLYSVDITQLQADPKQPGKPIDPQALDTLMTERGYNQEQLAGMIGKARTTMNEILSLNRLPQEVRDEGRADRAISRATLLEIARKSRPESMLKAYTRYKEKLKKAAEGGKKPGKSAQSAADVLDWLDKTGKKLGAIDPSIWTPGEKAALAEALWTLQETIKTLLAPENQPA